MSRLPRLTATEVLRALGHDGWYHHRQHGSHLVLRHPTKPGRVVIAVHAGETLKPKTLRSILIQAGLSEDDLKDLL